jgi:hypothetical protein
MAERSQNTSAVSRFVFTSPWLPLIFIALFAFAIYAEFSRIPMPRFFPTPIRFILFNNLCLLLVIALRFIDQIVRTQKTFYYAAGDRAKRNEFICPKPADTVRGELGKAGFCFDSSGYGEKRTVVPLAMSLVYGGILLALLVGSYDNYFHISGVFFQGEGAPAQLSDKSLYLNIVKGPLATLASLPKLQVRKNIYTAPLWPNGAVELALLDKNNKEIIKGTVGKYGKPLVYNGIEYHFGRFLTDIPLLIVSDDQQEEFQNHVKVKPLDKPEGNFTHYANFEGNSLLWDVLYDPTTRTIRLLGGKDGRNVVDGVYHFGRDTSAHMGPFSVSVPGLTNWAEIHVVHPRHMLLVFIGAGIMAVGILLRFIFHPQRVWLEETLEGCRVLAVGGKARKVLERSG